jgi:hypothetical protein
MQASIDEAIILPADSPAIQYATAAPHDRAAQLDARLRSGQSSLAYDRQFGYLEALLKALEVPAATQVLVFSKTSFQSPRIAPRTPRALYHNANVSIGYVQGGDVLEVAAVDPRQGVVFYTLDQEETAHPRLVRREECMHCHVGTSTLGVPGLVVRSVHADRNGQALLSARAYVTDHRSPIEQRWGGWYVTGLTGAQHHMGNQTVTDQSGVRPRGGVQRALAGSLSGYRRVLIAGERRGLSHGAGAPDAIHESGDAAGLGEPAGPQRGCDGRGTAAVYVVRG